MNLFDHGRQKFPVAALVTSSEALGWQGIGAELRAHPACELEPYTSAQTEVTLALRKIPGAVVSREANGLRQNAPVNSGTIWISPSGIAEEATRISAPLSDIVHIYLSHESFAGLGDELGGSALTEQSLDYVADGRDDLIFQMGVSLVSEIRNPTSSGRVLAESLGLCIAARLAQRYSCSSGAIKPSPTAGGRDLTDPRMRRVIDYMMAHLEQPIGLNDLAAVACLSPFHFARTFRDRTGVPPHRYLSVLRLNHAKVLLAAGNRALCDIALACQFSSQTNFTRAFRIFTGVTPSEFRKSS